MPSLASALTRVRDGDGEGLRSFAERLQDDLTRRLVSQLRQTRSSRLSFLRNVAESPIWSGKALVAFVARGANAMMVSRKAVICITGFSDRWRRLSDEVPQKSGGLNGSMQHLLGVYWPEFQSPKFFLDVD